MRLLLAALLALPALACAQGALTPPGAPAPTMKSLDQLEPRVALGAVGGSTAAITITQPGSYVLLGNLTVASGNAITIASSDITLDLGGFTLSSTANPSAGTGILINSGSNSVAIHDGHLRSTATLNGTLYSGTGFDTGISSTLASNVSVTNVSVEGLTQLGISVSGQIRDCSARTCGTTGLKATAVVDSRATACGLTGIQATQATRCSASSIRNVAITASSVVNCSATSNEANGITGDTVSASNGTSIGAGIGIQAITATDSYGLSASSTGLVASSSAANCHGYSTSGWGLSAHSAFNCHGTSQSGGIGLHTEYTAENCRGEIDSAPDLAVGLQARVATNCYGHINAATGIGCIGLRADTATGCTGIITASAAEVTIGTGLRADNALNCSGFSWAGVGLAITYNASNCTGTSNTGGGLYATNATNCHGETTTGNYGLTATGTATTCSGKCPGSGPAISTAIAIGCTAEAGTINATHRYNMP